MDWFRIVVSFSVVLSLSSCADHPSATPHPQTKPQQILSAQPLQYSIAESDDVSLGVGSKRLRRMALKITFETDEIPSEDVMRATVQKVWEDGNRHWDKLFVGGYMPEMPLNKGCFICADFENGEMTRFQVNKWTLLQTKWESKVPENNKPADFSPLSSKSIEKVPKDIILTFNVQPQENLLSLVSPTFQREPL